MSAKWARPKAVPNSQLRDAVASARKAVAELRAYAAQLRERAQQEGTDG